MIITEKNEIVACCIKDTATTTNNIYKIKAAIEMGSEVQVISRSYAKFLATLDLGEHFIRMPMLPTLFFYNWETQKAMNVCEEFDAEGNRTKVYEITE